MEQIITSKRLEEKLYFLGYILYEKEYFGFLKDAFDYVDRIKDFIYTIPSLPARKCKNPKYGKYFVRYDNKKSKMQYFITFDKKGNRFYVQNVISPKTKDYYAIIGDL